MAGKIYGVGVGPGDPELLTIKAARLIKNAGVIGIPAEHKETCKAYQIAAGAVEEIREKEVVPFPFLMTRDPERLKESHDRLAEKAAGYLDQGRDLVFLTLGDPAVYSTYMYLHRRLTAMGYEAEIVSGVTSFCAAAVCEPGGWQYAHPYPSGLLSPGGGAFPPRHPGANEIRKTDGSREKGPGLRGV